MAYRRRGRGGSDVVLAPNLTPLLDVVLQLITFFMMLIHFGSRLEGEARTVRLPVTPSALPGTDLAIETADISLLADEWAVIAELLDGLSAEQWSSTVLPGWDVHDVLAHLAGTEYSLAGAALPDVPAEVGPHVHNDIGKVNELWVTALRSRSDTELLADFRELTAGRVASLRAMPSSTPFRRVPWSAY